MVDSGSFWVIGGFLLGFFLIGNRILGIFRLVPPGFELGPPPRELGIMPLHCIPYDRCSEVRPRQTHLVLGWATTWDQPRRGPLGLGACLLLPCCLLDAQAPPWWSNSLINRLTYYVPQLGDPNPDHAIRSVKWSQRVCRSAGCSTPICQPAGQADVGLRESSS